VQVQVWPTEDYQLALSRVKRVQGLEGDLFAGVREWVAEVAA
jgi:hypothetical protein